MNSFLPAEGVYPQKYVADQHKTSDLGASKVFGTSGKKKGSVRRETNALSGLRETIVQNRHRKPRRPLSHQYQEAEVRREKETSEAKLIWEVQPTAVQTLLERYLH